MILRTTMLFNCMYRTSIFLYLLGMRHAVLCLDDDILGQSPFQFTDADMEHYNPDRILQPTYVATASRIIRPGSIYRMNIVIFPESPDMIVRALITKGNSHQVAASSSELINAGSSHLLSMKIPLSITDGDYRLKLEGYEAARPDRIHFVKQSMLTFHSEFLAIVVQTNRKVYCNSMSVKFRVIAMEMNLKPFNDPVTVYILDPSGFIMRRWPSRFPTNGVITLDYQLPSHPREGKWIIRVEAITQVFDQIIYVEQFYLPLFEILPHGPVYVLDSEEKYTTSFTTAFHSQRVSHGNATTRIYAKPINSTAKMILVNQETVPWTFVHDYEVYMRDLKRSLNVNNLVGWLIRVEMTLNNFFMGEERSGYIETRIIHAELRLRFAGPKTAFIKPGLPFEGHVYVMYDDNQALSKEKLAKASLTLKTVVNLANGQVKTLPDIIVPPKGEYLAMSKSGYPHRDNEFDRWMEEQAQDAEFGVFRTKGIHRFRVLVPKDATSIKMTAQYRDEEFDVTTAELQAVAFYSTRDFHIHVSTSTEQAELNEFAVFHLKSNFHFQDFSYVVISKGILIHGNQQNHDHPTKSLTFPVSVSTDMAPSFKLMVTVINPLGELVADSVTVPVRSINRYKVNVTLEQSRDHSKQTVQVVTRTHSASFVGVSLLRWVNQIFQADNTLTPSRMLKALYHLEPFTRSVHGVTWTDREGLQADLSEYFTGSNPGPDTKRTISLAGLLVFTDARVTQHPSTLDCDKSKGYESCMIGGCFHHNQRCDGKLDCTDGSDEEDCTPLADDRMEFRIFRRSRNHDFYDYIDGDWAWYDIPVFDDDFEFRDRAVAQINEVWYFNAFSFHSELGFSIIEKEIEYDGSPPYYATVEAPRKIRRGETVGIRLLIINNLPTEMVGVVVLEPSDDYRFVETGPDGEVEHLKPSLVAGEKHHVVSSKPESMIEVTVPIAPQIEKGTIFIRIICVSQISRQVFDIDIEILPEGATISRSTSLMLDLKNRAYLLRFLDIPVEESPIIPYSKFRRYIFGSPRASITLCGDVFGPVFPVTPISTDSFLSRSLRGTEAHLFNLAATSWSLHYLRLTNQLKSEVLYRRLNDMNVQLADLMRLFHLEGSFRAHSSSYPSVFITAWVLRVLGQSQFQDWENHYIIDRKLLASCVRWILSYQNNDGTFSETRQYSYPLDRRLWSNTSHIIGHTAHVLIALSKCTESLDGNLKSEASTAKSIAVSYLERTLPRIDDPYEAAIVAHALSIVNSPVKETAFGRLHKMQRKHEGMIYWSRKPVPPNAIVYENQRPFIQPRPPTDQDSVAVEASSYALLVYLARDGIGDLQERVVNWLNTMRMVDGGFVSIFDTMVAMEALTEYAYRARLRDITEMNVLVEASASPKSNELVKISRENLASVYRLDIPNVWGHVNVIGRGAGQAVLQLKIQYGIDWEDLRDQPNRPYFDLFVEETYSHFRNKSHITVNTCVKWLAIDEAPMSGAVTIEVEMPSGYGYVQSDANQRAADYGFIRDVLVAPDKVVWMLEKVGAERLCFDYQIRRWFPVANMTMYRSAIAYESHSPEHFEMYVFNATELYVLDICEVCGSYQCPYCPYFSSAPSMIFSLDYVHQLAYTSFVLLIYFNCILS